jgi:hypothetical protein
MTTNLQTVTTLELSTKCNLSCEYCINRLLEINADRTPMIMPDDVFNASCVIIEQLCKNGTQREINLNGNGESLLDPQLIKRIGIIREIVGKERFVGLSTNGTLVTPEIASQLANAGLSQIDVSPHLPYAARKAANLLFEAGMKVHVNFGPITMSHNWANQIEPEYRIKCKIHNQCDPLIEGRGYILAEGNITACCYDYRNLGIFGTVYALDILSRPIKPYALCKSCHQTIPEYILKENNFIQREQK